jgi:CheY-like chemotaxis protein
MAASFLESLRILVIDDEPDSIDILKMVLSTVGATMFTASNGKEGLAVFRREDPNLVLTDLSMPDIDGWQLLEQIRKEENGKKTSVIALTAHAMAGDRERVMTAGFDGYLSKPVKMFTLLDDLEECLKREKKPECQSADTT